MLAKKYRFQSEKNPDFFRRAQRWRGEVFDALWLASQSASGFKTTFIVSKKVAPRATQRNYLRRVLTPLLQAELKSRPEFWGDKTLVLSFKTSAAAISTTDRPKIRAAILADWQNFLKKLTILSS